MLIKINKIYCLLLILYLSPMIAATCSDSLSCFRKKLFNFGYPGESIYHLNSITLNNTDKSLNVFGYGDFNNDLHTDFVAMNNNTTMQVYLWSNDEESFVLNFTVNNMECTPTSIFLYDLNSDGSLDIVAWGNSTGNTNCMQPYIQSAQTYNKGQLVTMQQTTNPFIISYGQNNGVKTTGMLVYLNGSRVIMKYESGAQNFIMIPWGNIFVGSNVGQVGFASPHWNSFLDLTGDCRSDVVILDKGNNLQFWIANQKGFVFQNSINLGTTNITSLSFADMDYDGVIEMIMATSSQIRIYNNSRKLTDYLDFCKPQYVSVQFVESQITKQFPQGYSMQYSNLQIKDINIDGYPDLLLYLSPTGSTSNQVVKIYINNQFRSFQQDDQYKLPVQTFSGIISVSFIDFWENGILDIIVSTQSNGIMSFYNNYLQQNLFYIKGYGANGITVNNGVQIVGANFYWVNSVGEGYRTTYQTQILQTAYNALQTPFAYCGLGRANNYAQSFTMGIFGQYYSWTPIIPNSQLAVYAQGSNANQWAIRIFVLPTESLIYVIIVSALVLTILGAILGGLKCKNYRKKDAEPLMEFIH